MKLIRTLTLISLTLISSWAWSATALLSGITTKRIGSDFFIEMSFNQDVSERDIKVEYVNKVIEFSIPEARSSQTRKTAIVKDTIIDRLLTAKGPTNSMLLRVVLNGKYAADDFGRTTSFLTKGSRVLLKVGDPSKAPPGTAPGALQGELAEETPSEASRGMPGKMIDALMKKTDPQAAQAASEPVLASADQGAEDSQPVFKTKTKEPKVQTASVGDVWGKLVMSLLLIGGIGGAAFYLVKKSPQAKKLSLKGRMIEVLAQHPLGPKKSVAVIRVAGEAVLVGITDSNISILKTLSLLDDDVPAAKFQSSLANQVAQAVRAPSKGATASSADDFTMKGLKEIVSERLKNMRSLG
jgi:flagellar protein FliO/FliZ